VELKQAIDSFNGSEELRTCDNCQHVMPEEVSLWKNE